MIGSELSMLSSSLLSTTPMLFEASIFLNNKGVDLFESGDVDSARKCFLSSIHNLRCLLHDLQAQRRSRTQQRALIDTDCEEENRMEPQAIEEEGSSEQPGFDAGLNTISGEIHKEQTETDTAQSEEEHPASQSFTEFSASECHESESDRCQQSSPSLYLQDSPLRVPVSNVTEHQVTWQQSSNVAALVAYNVALTYHLLSMKKNASSSEPASNNFANKHRHIAMTFYHVSMEWRKLGCRPSLQLSMSSHILFLDLSTLNNIAVLYEQQGSSERSFLWFETLYSLLVLVDPLLISSTYELRGFMANLAMVLPFQATFSASAA